MRLCEWMVERVEKAARSHMRQEVVERHDCLCSEGDAVHIKESMHVYFFSSKLTLLARPVVPH